MARDKGMKKKDDVSQAEWERTHPPQVMDGGEAEITTDYSKETAKARKIVLGNPSPESEIEARFTYHAPRGDQAARYIALRAAGKALAFLINKYCPPSREKELALTALDTVIMWANAAIARREK